MSTIVLELREAQALVERLNERTWCASQPGLGLAVYGNDEEQAIGRLTDAIGFLFDVLLDSGGFEAVKARFDRAGVEFELLRRAPVEPSTPRTLPLAMTLARLAGAASS